MNLRPFRRQVRRSYFWFKKYPLYPIWDQLEQSQYWKRSELAALQDEKLRRLIHHAYETVPFYRRRMDERKLKPDDVRTVGDLPKLPVLTRQEVRAAGRELLSSAKCVGQPIKATTGGSTGEPLTAWNDLRGTAWGMAAYLRGLRWAGYDLDRDRLAILFAGSLKPGRSVVGSTKWGDLTLSLSALDVRRQTVPAYYESLQRFRPRFLKGFGNATYLLARGFERAGYPRLKLQGVFTTSEHLPDYQRQYIENAFQTEVFDYYGCVEITSLGYECPRHTGYHIPEEHAVVETIAVAQEQARGPRGGAFVLTDLDNHYMPLIRYRNGDAGVLTDEPCPCGRTLKRISPLFGRVSDLLRATDGNLVYGGIVDYVLGKTKHIREFCLIQEEPVRCRLQYVMEQSDHEIPEVVANLRQFLGSDMDIITEPVETIPLTGSGKRRFTISRLNDR
jgi:phenylacetate-CoA ligase